MSKIKKIIAGVAIAGAVTLGGMAPAATAAPVQAVSAAGIEAPSYIQLKLVTGVYRWWVPFCWNVGYGVPGGTQGWCYDG